jgi:hypothetical protein
MTANLIIEPAFFVTQHLSHPSPATRRSRP